MGSKSYAGTAANADPSGSADWADPILLILDGEVWEDSTVNVEVLQVMIDRSKWVKTHGGWIDKDNVWTGQNDWHHDATFGNNMTLTVGAGSTIAIDGHIHIDDGGNIEVLGNGAGGLFHMHSGSTISVDAGTLGTISCDGFLVNAGVVSVTAGGITVTNAPVERVGNGAVEYRRVSTAPDVATPHVGTTADVWQIPMVLTANRNYIVDAPPNTAKHAILELYRPEGDGAAMSTDNKQVGFLQPDGTTGIASMNDPAVFTAGGVTGKFAKPNGTNSRYACLRIEWSPTLTKWRVLSYGGACMPNDTVP